MASGEMTDHQKARDAYSLHQDVLFWSRVQTLLVLQAGILSGMYIVRPYLWLASPLAVIGIVLTNFVFWTAERDQAQRDEAFNKSGLTPVLPSGSVTAKIMMRWTFGILLVSDVYLIAWIWIRRFLVED